MTQQKLSPTRDGASWYCLDGQHDGDSYTKQQMHERLEAMAAKLPPRPPVVVPPLQGVRVFVEGASPNAPERELDPQFIRMHAEALGALPEVGKPLSRAVSNLPAPFNIITYGKVVRVICPQTPTTTSKPSP